MWEYLVKTKESLFEWELNFISNQGWELIHCMHINNEFKLIFKRPKHA